MDYFIRYLFKTLDLFNCEAFVYINGISHWYRRVHVDAKLCHLDYWIS